MHTPEPPASEAMMALDEAIRIAGGVGQLADRIGAPSRNSPSNWKARRSVPAEYCPAIERETGVRCERFCPNVAWDVLRMQTAEVSA